MPALVEVESALDMYGGGERKVTRSVPFFIYIACPVKEPILPIALFWNMSTDSIHTERGLLALA